MNKRFKNVSEVYKSKKKYLKREKNKRKFKIVIVLSIVIRSFKNHLELSRAINIFQNLPILQIEKKEYLKYTKFNVPVYTTPPPPPPPKKIKT